MIAMMRSMTKNVRVGVVDDFGVGGEISILPLLHFLVAGVVVVLGLGRRHGKQVIGVRGEEENTAEESTVVIEDHAWYLYVDDDCWWNAVVAQVVASHFHPQSVAV